MSFNIFEVSEWVLHYRNIWNKVEWQFCEKMTTELIKAEGKQKHGKLKTLNERIKANFHGQKLLYNMYCNATAVLKIYSVCKQVKN